MFNIFLQRKIFHWLLEEIYLKMLPRLIILSALQRSEKDKKPQKLF